MKRKTHSIWQDLAWITAAFIIGFYNGCMFRGNYDNEIRYKQIMEGVSK